MALSEDSSVSFIEEDSFFGSRNEKFALKLDEKEVGNLVVSKKNKKEIKGPIPCLLSGSDRTELVGILRILYLASLKPEPLQEKLRQYKQLIQECVLHSFLNMSKKLTEKIKSEHIEKVKKSLKEKKPPINSPEIISIISNYRDHFIKSKDDRLCRQIYFIENLERILSEHYEPTLEDCYYLWGPPIHHELGEYGFCSIYYNEQNYRIYIQDDPDWHPLYEYVYVILYVQDGPTLTNKERRKDYLRDCEKLSADTSSSVNPLHTIPVYCVITQLDYVRKQFTGGGLSEWSNLSDLEDDLENSMKKRLSRCYREYGFQWLECNSLLSNFSNWVTKAVSELYHQLNITLIAGKLTVNVVDNFITSEKTRYIISCPMITHGLSVSYMDEKSWLRLAKALERKQVTELSLRNNGKPDKIPSFMKSLSQSKTLKILNLSFCGLIDIDVLQMCEILPESPLETLILSNNQLTERSLKGISLLLQKSELKKLDLSLNPLGAIASLVASALSSPLTHLYLWDSGLTNQDGPALCALIQHSFTLQCLNIASNPFSESVSRSFLRAFERNPFSPIYQLHIPITSGSDYALLCQLLLRPYTQNREKEVNNINSKTPIEGGKIYGVHQQLAVFPVDSLLQMNQVQQIRILDLSHNSIEQIPSPLFDLQHLEELILHDNIIVSVPPVIRSFQELTVLDLRNNMITEFSVSPRDIKSLKNLLLQGNKLSSLPLESFLLHPNLKSLSVLNNQLPTVSQHLIDNFLSRSPVLNLSNLDLEWLPHELYLFTHLTRLDVSRNLLQKLAPEIAFLTGLTELDVSYNLLDDVPWQLGKLSNLTQFVIEQNPLSKLPSLTQVDTPSIETIFSALEVASQTASATNVNSCRIRLMFVGEEKVGKTSLCDIIQEVSSKKKQKLFNKHRKFLGPRKSENLSTDGVRIVNWQVNKVDLGTNVKRTSSVENSDQSLYQYTIYDFAGQEVYLPTHIFFLSHEAIYLVVFNILQTEAYHLNRIEYWISNVRAFVKGACPILVVATHIDNSKCTSKHIQNLTTLFSEKYGVKMIATSCTKKKGIDKLCEEILSTSRALPSFARKVSTQMVSLEEHLFFLRNYKDIMSFSELETIVKLFGFTDVDSTVDYLNDMGTIFLLGEDARARHRMVILNPQWLSTLMSTLVSTKFGDKGKLERKDLLLIWKPPLFPESVHGSLLELLEKLGVVYRLPPKNSKLEDDRKHSWEQLLVPCLLPDKPPGESRNEKEKRMASKSSKMIRLIYKLSVIPQGVSSRLMTHIFKICPPQDYWKNEFQVQKDDIDLNFAIESSENTISIFMTFHPIFISFLVDVMSSILLDSFNYQTFELFVACPACSNEKIHLHDIKALEAGMKDSLTIPCSVDPSAPPVPLFDLAPHLVINRIFEFSLKSVNSEEFKIISNNFKPSTNYAPFISILQRKEFSQILKATQMYSFRKDHVFSGEVITSLIYASSVSKDKTSRVLEALVVDEINGTSQIDTLFRMETPSIFLMAECTKLEPSVQYSSSIVSKLTHFCESNMDGDGLSQEKQIELVEYSLHIILNSVDSCPDVIKFVCATINDAITGCSNQEIINKKNIYIGSFFFLRFLNPVIIRTTQTLNPSMKKPLLQLSKLIQMISNGVELSEPYTHIYHKYSPLLPGFFAQLCRTTTQKAEKELNKERTSLDIARLYFYLMINLFHLQKEFQTLYSFLKRSIMDDLSEVIKQIGFHTDLTSTIVNHLKFQIPKH